MKVFLNPGHDRSLDSGAVNPVTGSREADVVHNITVAITNSINHILTNNGVDTKCLQDNSLSAITSRANSWDADLFVSIHCNAFNTIARGTETEVYSYGTEAERLAKVVNSSIVNRLGTVDRGVKERPGLYVLGYTNMPAILVELAFIDNMDDEKLLTTRGEEFAKAVAAGILNYIGKEMKDTAGSVLIAPNGKPYEQNDIDYLIKQGYTYGGAISFLSTSDKYSTSDINSAIQWAESMVGKTGYGNNGCTAFVRDFLLHANSFFGKLMKDGSQGNLMWVPNIMEYAKANSIWKEPEDGGAPGDICLLETNGDWSDGPDHVVIVAGNGQYYGNSSSRNKIVKSSIAYDFGEDAVWGYVSTGSGASTKVEGKTGRTMNEIVGDAGTTSGVVHYLAPNGKIYEANDIQYLLNLGYTTEKALDELSKCAKYALLDNSKRGPNGKPYEENDINYLLKQGYSYDAAISFLATADKYAS